MGFYLPKTLEKYNNWVLWRLEDGKKKPFSAKYNGLASVSKYYQWASYGQALAKLQYTGEYNGLGFVFTKACGLVFIDLDNCINEDSGEPSDFAAEILELFAGNYIEYSQSGRGLHIVTRGTIPAAYKSAKIELYNDLRYMAFTGNAYEANEPKPSQTALNELAKRFNITEQTAPAARIGADTQPTADDIEIIRKAERGANGAQFRALWAGEWQGKYSTQSNADLRLISLLWYYSRNYEQVARLFLASGLGQREKAQRADYIQRTIETAARNAGIYQPTTTKQPRNNQQTEQAKPQYKKRSYWK